MTVPNATVMVIEHAERFGLAQLHQLRGRVGRGQAASLCLLLAQYAPGDESQRRLQVMTETDDGFKIAEADLTFRGPGEFLGTRQSGMPDFRVANIVRDSKLLETARDEALAWLERDPNLIYPRVPPPPRRPRRPLGRPVGAGQGRVELFEDTRAGER